MQRRGFIAGDAASALARPAIAAGTAPLVFVPQTNLTSLDPVWTAATVTRNFAMMVYETLYGRDISCATGCGSTTARRCSRGTASLPCKTLVWRLHKPFPTLPYFLSKA